MEQELKELLQENKRTLDRLEARIKKIERRFVWGAVWNVVKIIIIVGPIVVGLIYLSPYINKYFQAFKPIFEFYGKMAENPSFQTEINSLLNNQNTNSAGQNQQIPPEVLQSFCNPQTRDVIVQQICK